MRNQIFYRLVSVVGLLGGVIAFVTVDRYEIVVRAALGCAVLYLLYREYSFPRGIASMPPDSPIEFLDAVKLLIGSFLAMIIAFWACVQVLDLIRYLINIFRANL